MPVLGRTDILRGLFTAAWIGAAMAGWSTILPLHAAASTGAAMTVGILATVGLAVAAAGRGGVRGAAACALLSSLIPAYRDAAFAPSTTALVILLFSWILAAFALSRFARRASAVAIVALEFTLLHVHAAAAAMILAGVLIMIGTARMLDFPRRGRRPDPARLGFPVAVAAATAGFAWVAGHAVLHAEPLIREHGLGSVTPDPMRVAMAAVWVLAVTGLRALATRRPEAQWVAIAGAAAAGSLAAWDVFPADWRTVASSSGIGAWTLILVVAAALVHLMVVVDEVGARRSRPRLLRDRHLRSPVFAWTAFVGVMFLAIEVQARILDGNIPGVNYVRALGLPAIACAAVGLAVSIPLRDGNGLAGGAFLLVLVPFTAVRFMEGDVPIPAASLALVPVPVALAGASALAWAADAAARHGPRVWTGLGYRGEDAPSADAFR